MLLIRRVVEGRPIELAYPCNFGLQSPEQQIGFKRPFLIGLRV